MAQKKKNYSRASERLPVSTREISGRLLDENGNENAIALVWNISAQGLCLWVAGDHEQGQRVTLSITLPWKGTIQCVVRWTREIPDRSGYLIGLEALDNHEQLVELHRRITKNGKTAG